MSFNSNEMHPFEKLGDKKNEAGVIHHLGMIAQAQGKYGAARQLYQQSLEIFERLGSPDAETARRNLANLEERVEGS